jgi:hypothetical protein
MHCNSLESFLDIHVLPLRGYSHQLGPVALITLFDTGVLLLHDLLTSSIKDFGNIYS